MAIATSGISIATRGYVCRLSPFGPSGISIATRGYVCLEAALVAEAIGTWLAYASGMLWQADPGGFLWQTACSTVTWTADKESGLPWNPLGDFSDEFDDGFE